MAAPYDIRGHRLRCEPHLVRLQMVALSEAHEPLAPGLAEEVAKATGAVLAEAKAAAAANNQRRAVTVFLDARIARLAAAAGEAVAAARDADVVALCQHLRKFEVLTSALWTVQLEVSDNKESRPRVRRSTAGRGPTRLGSRGVLAPTATTKAGVFKST
jgi:hypothetical protein